MLEASKGLGNPFARRRLRPVSLKSFHVHGRADNVLDAVTSAGLVDVASERPLADAPVLDRALRLTIRASAVVAGHVLAAPVGLAGDRAEISSSPGRHVDAYVVTTSIVVLIHAVSIPCEPGKSSTRARASRKFTAEDICVGVG